MTTTIEPGCHDRMLLAAEIESAAMPRYFVRETFFRPGAEFGRETSTIPARVHNGLQLLLGRSGGRSVFIPIRSMQYLAVAEPDEIVFVDAQGGYAHQDGEGGRLIRLAWRPAVGRESLTAPVPCEMVYYFGGLQGVQSRLLADIGPVLRQMLERQRDDGMPARSGRILPFRRPR